MISKYVGPVVNEAQVRVIVQLRKCVKAFKYISRLLTIMMWIGSFFLPRVCKEDRKMLDANIEAITLPLHSASLWTHRSVLDVDSIPPLIVQITTGTDTTDTAEPS